MQCAPRCSCGKHKGRKCPPQCACKRHVGCTCAPTHTCSHHTVEYRAKLSRGVRASITDERREIMSAKAKEQHRLGQLGAQGRLTTLECGLYTLLSQSGLRFVPQRVFGTLAVDAYVPSHQLVFEADGSYWERYKDHPARDAVLTAFPEVVAVVHLDEADLAPFTPASVPAELRKRFPCRSGQSWWQGRHHSEASKEKMRNRSLSARAQSAANMCRLNAAGLSGAGCGWTETRRRNQSEMMRVRNLADPPSRKPGAGAKIAAANRRRARERGR